MCSIFFSPEAQVDEVHLSGRYHHKDVESFRGLLQERRARGVTGRNWLLLGEHHVSTDFCYRDELEGMHPDGLITQLSLAFPRDQAEIGYVQGRM